RHTTELQEILTEVTAGMQINPTVMRRNLAIHGNYMFVGRLSQWLAPVAETYGVAESGGGKHWVQAVCNAALANNEDLAKALATHFPDGAVSVADIEKMLEPSSYTGGAA